MPSPASLGIALPEDAYPGPADARPNWREIHGSENWRARRSSLCGRIRMAGTGPFRKKLNPIGNVALRAAGKGCREQDRKQYPHQFAHG